MSYAENLRHPKWQEKRLRVLESAGFCCAGCGDDQRPLHAHHKLYLPGHKPWEYEDLLLECLCELCHGAAHNHKRELEWLIAQHPSAKLPELRDAVAAALTNEPMDPSLSLRAGDAMRKIGHAPLGSDPTLMIDAQNHLQDVIDEWRDFRRGPGSTWRQAT